MKKYDSAIIFSWFAACLLISLFWFAAGKDLDWIINSRNLAAHVADISGSSKGKTAKPIDLNSGIYDKERFKKAVGFAEDIKIANNIVAVIAPHDVNALEYSAALLKKAKGRKIDRVFVIGPNHQNIGDFRTASCFSDWITFWGRVEADKEAVGNLTGVLNLNLSPDIFENEHSIGIFAALIKKYYPDAKLIPIVLNSYYDLPMAERLSGWLAENIQENDLVVFSIDFSHYLSKQEANMMDQKTMEMIEKKDVERIINLNNDYVDSPGSLAVALLLAGKLNLNTALAYHTNSFDLVPFGSSQTTSHLGYLFRK